MKKTALGALALAGTLFVQLAGAAPSTAVERPVITKTVTKGEGMTSEFERTDGCIHTRITVFGSVFTVTGSATPDLVGFVSVTQEDTCTGMTLINGFGDADTLNLAVPNGLSKGRLRMSMDFTNYADPEIPVISPMTADVSFRATASATKTFTESKSRSEGVRFVASQGTRSRPASVSGTVILGDQKILTPSISSFSATIASVISKEKTVNRLAK